MSIQMTQDARPDPIACGTTMRVGSGDAALLPASARRDGALWRVVACELAADHDASHAAFLAAADGGEQWWWLRWSLQTRDIVQIDPCAVVGFHGGYRDDCMLHDGHHGSHSYELRLR
jgi:hypothetical protein